MSGEGTALMTPPRWCPCSLSEPHVTTPTCSSPIDEVATAKRTTWCHLSTGNPSVICAALKVTPKLLWPLRSLRVVWPSEDSPTSWSNTFLLWGRHNGLLSCVSNKQAFLCPRQGGLGSQHPLTVCSPAVVSTWPLILRLFPLYSKFYAVDCLPCFSLTCSRL